MEHLDARKKESRGKSMVSKRMSEERERGHYVME